MCAPSSPHSPRPTHSPDSSKEQCSETFPNVSAEELHLFLLRTYRLGNRVRHRFLKALLALEKSGRYPGAR